jgi:hypothetical protein
VYQEEEDSKEYHTPQEELSEQKSNYQEFVEPDNLQHVFHEQRQSNAPNGSN